jgi:hypothetical protein
MLEGSRGTVPRALVVVLGGIAAILAVMALVLGIFRLVRGDTGLSGLSKAEQAALSAAKQETINIQSYRLKTFDQDFAAAVAGMTPDKATEWQARKKDLKDGLTRLKQDGAATVSGAGIQSFDGKSAVVLVSSDSQRVDQATDKSTTFAQNRFQVTMKLVGGKWLMSDLQAVSLS